MPRGINHLAKINQLNDRFVKGPTKIYIAVRHETILKNRVGVRLIFIILL